MRTIYTQNQRNRFIKRDNTKLQTSRNKSTKSTGNIQTAVQNLSARQ